MSRPFPHCIIDTGNDTPVNSKYLSIETFTHTHKSACALNPSVNEFKDFNKKKNKNVIQKNLFNFFTLKPCALFSRKYKSSMLG